MKFNCEKTLLRKAIATASRAVAQKSSIPALEGLLIHAGEDGVTISGYNMQTGIRAKISADVTEPGDIVLNSRLFGDIIYRMPDDIVTFTAGDKFQVRLCCGYTDYKIDGLSASDYPDLPEVEDEFSISIQQRTLRAMIEEVAFAVSTNESRPVHTGALFEVSETELTMAAVDGFRLAVRKEPLDNHSGGNFSFVAPGQALNEVKGVCDDVEDLAKITLGKRHILFTAGGVELICRRLEGEFMNYRNAIPSKNPIAVTVNAKSMIESIDRVSVMISDKLKSPVRCRFEQGKVLLSSRTANGDAKDVCTIDGDGQELEIGFNNRYLMEALRYAPADTVRIELNTSISPAVIVPADEKDHFLYMVLPVRLKSQD